MSILHERMPHLPYVSLGPRPTPLRPLDVPGEAAVWVKDEASVGDGGWGGNKVRKLEWLIPDALAKGRRTILTVGGLGTNWGLACALYGKEHGLQTVLALVDQPVDDHVTAQLDRLRASGATLHFTHTKARTIVTVPWLLARHASGGRLPYLLGAGGSSPVGALGYVDAALEIAAQVRAGAMEEPTHIVVPVGSGGTAAGLLLGFALAGMSTRVVAVVVNDTLRLDAKSLLGLAEKSRALLGETVALEPGRLVVVRDWLGPGYGHATAEGEQAQRSYGTQLDLDPVYTGKAMAALTAMNEQGRFGSGPVLFLQTNGPR